MAYGNDNVVLANNSGYAPKMDKTFTSAVKSWWESLTKEELLDYLRDQPAMTADVIRNMLANEQCVLAFGVKFSTSSQDAITDFCNDPNKK